MCIDPNQNHLQKVFSKMRQKRFCMWWGILICETYKISGNILKHFWQSESLVLGQTPFQFMGIDVWCCVATTPEAPLLYLWFHVKLSTMMDTPHYKHPKRNKLLCFDNNMHDYFSDAKSPKVRLWHRSEGITCFGSNHISFYISLSLVLYGKHHFKRGIF